MIIQAPTLRDGVEIVVNTVQHGMERRAFLSANELKTASMQVLRGERHGRRYKVPGTYKKQKDPVTGKIKNGRYYTASAPGEPPAVRTGVFRLSWKPKSMVYFDHYLSRVESTLKTDNGVYTLGEILENGTGRMAPRPYQDAVIERAMPHILRIYNRSYF